MTNTKLNPNQLPTTALQSVNVTLTADEIKALVAVPIKIADAPGAGFFIDPTRMRLLLDAGTPYVVPGDSLVLMLGDTFATTPWPWTVIGDSLLTSATDKTDVGDVSDSINGDPADFANLGLYITKDGAVEFADGDGTLKITVDYLITPAT